MVQYRRNRVSGGTYFFTNTLRDRHAMTLVEYIDVLRTAMARTRTRTRPSLGRVVPPDCGAELFGYLLTQARQRHVRVQAGRFGAHMRGSRVNDGPVTFWLETPPA